MIKHERPWGTYEILLDSHDCKVKRIVVRPEQSISYQYHHHRHETWVIVSGMGTLTLEDVESVVEPGFVVKINPLEKHKISAHEDPLVFIEVQRGSYFEEDDIVRLSDQYGRC